MLDDGHWRGDDFEERMPLMLSFLSPCLLMVVAAVGADVFVAAAPAGVQMHEPSSRTLRGTVVPSERRPKSLHQHHNMSIGLRSGSTSVGRSTVAALQLPFECESQKESIEGFKSLLNALRWKPESNKERFLNLEDTTAIASWLELREWEMEEAGIAIWPTWTMDKPVLAIPPSLTKGTTNGVAKQKPYGQRAFLERIVIMGTRNNEALYDSRYNNMNARLTKLGFDRWVWQLKWNKTEVYSNVSTARYWLTHYVSHECRMDDLFDKNPTLHGFEWSLSLKHIMTLHDAVHNCQNHSEYGLKDTRRETSLSPLSTDASGLMMLEDDVIFVPFFKQKLDLTIAALPVNTPWIVWIGGCLNMHAEGTSNAILPNSTSIKIQPQLLGPTLTGIHFSPFLELVPMWGSRCTTGYVLNKLAAVLILNAMAAGAKDNSVADSSQHTDHIFGWWLFPFTKTKQKKKGPKKDSGLSNQYRPIDHHLRDILGNVGTNICSYWSEPVLAYQSNRAIQIERGDIRVGSHRNISGHRHHHRRHKR